MSSKQQQLTVDNVRSWLAERHPKQLVILDRFEMELRLGRLSSSSSSSSSSNNNNNNQNQSNNNKSKSLSWSDRRAVTYKTVELLRILMGSTKWQHAAELLTLLRGLGKELHAVGGFREPAIGNVVRRIMAAVREETINLFNNNNNNNASSFMENHPTTTSPAVSSTIQSILWAQPTTNNIMFNNNNNNNSKRTFRHATTSSFSEGGNNSDPLHQYGGSRYDDVIASLPPAFFTPRPELKHILMEFLAELLADLEDLHKNIEDQALNHIYDNEVILTFGKSKSVELFLKAAAKKRSFSVIICEGQEGQQYKMVQSLLDGEEERGGIDKVVVISNAALFAIMSRVNKVLLPAHAVLANGGLISWSGSNLVALAARQFAVPVICITGLFKLCPMFPHEGQDTLQDLAGPGSVMDYAELNNMNGGGDEKKQEDELPLVELMNPVRDYTPPESISLYVTNVGAFQPSYIYRVLAENYHSDDWETFE